MTAHLVNSLATTDTLAAAFGDRALLGELLAVETALARVQARAGIIPGPAAEVIERAARVDDFDPAAMARDARRSATIAIPFVEALRARVASLDSGAATWVHWGLTSQDLVDTAFVRCVRGAQTHLRPVHDRLVARLRVLSDEHAGTVMLARTLLQPAVPTTFGLKAATWCAGIDGSWRAIDAAAAGALVLQCGGAGGTLASLGEAGPAVADGLARELELPNPGAPWHTRRDRLAALAASYGIYVGALGKGARDVSLLMQAEVGELSGEDGGSSAMPQKRNPAGCAIALSAATVVPGLVSASLAALVQEHERAVGPSQAEWSLLTAIVSAAAASADAMARTFDNLTVHPDRMRANLTATRGEVFAERVTLRLAREVGRETAIRLVAAALASSRAHGESLVGCLTKMAEVTQVVPLDELEAIDRPEDYLGAADLMRRRLLSGAGPDAG